MAIFISDEHKELVIKYEALEERLLAAQSFIDKLSCVFGRRFPRCRDCADNAGDCPESGLPCEWPNFTMVGSK